MLDGVDGAMTDLLPTGLRAWLRDARSSKPADEPYLYRELAASRVSITRECFKQDTNACIDALGLGRALAPDAWYSVAQLGRFVEHKYGSSAAAVTCIASHVREACVEVLTQLGGVPLPLSAGARASLLRFAVERGGRGAIARIANAESPSEALTAAARADLPTLVGSWRQHIERKRPVVNAGTARIGLATLIWVGLALALAMRSTRERL